MVYYLLLFMAALLFGSQFMIVKGYERRSGVSVNAAALFSMISGLSGFLIFFAANGFRLVFRGVSVWMALLLAAITVASNVLGIQALARGSIAVYSLFMMLGGMTLPFLVGVLFLKEPLSAVRILGVVLLAAALALPAVSGRKRDGQPPQLLFYGLCAILFVLNGMSSVICKLHQIHPDAVETTGFMVLMYGWLFLLSALLYAVTGRKTRVQVNRQAIVLGMLFSVVNGTAAFCQLISARHVYASAQFPIITGGTMVFSLLLGFWIYRERPGRAQVGQIGLACIATMLFLF